MPITISGDSPNLTNPTFSGLTNSGNLAFTGTGNRITGDMSNATIASRMAFQTSTANSPTSVSAIPSGTGTQADMFVFNNSDPTNAGLLLARISSTETTIRSAITGTGTYLPMTFWTNNAEKMRIDTSGGVTIAGLAGTGSRAVNASAAGLLSAASDSSLKEEVKNAHIAGIAEIMQIHPKVYKWKDDIANRGNNAAEELGFFANDVAPIIPSAAPMGNDGLYGFYDRSIIAALVKATQEQQELIESLTTRLMALENK